MGPQAVVGAVAAEGLVVGGGGAADVEPERVGQHVASKLDDAYHSTTQSPAAIGVPWSDVSTVAVRRMWSTGWPSG